MSVGRGSGVALWRQIAETLEADIAQRVFPPGGRLPTEDELAARFGVNRHTLRRAVALLQDQGLLRVEQGRGTFVQEGVIDYPLSKRTRFSEIIRKQARSVSGQVLRMAHLPADAAVARALEIAPGETVALIEARGMVDEAPLSLAMHHFPAARFPDILEVYQETGGVTAALTRLGAGDYTRKVTRVTARLPDSYEMHHLQLSRTTPILVSEAINVDGAGRPVEYGVTKFAANRVQIVFES